MLQPFRKPLVVMTPKSLLRHELSVSTLEDLSSGGLQVLVQEHHRLGDSVHPHDVGLVLQEGVLVFDLLAVFFHELAELHVVVGVACGAAVIADLEQPEVTVVEENPFVREVHEVLVCEGEISGRKSSALLELLEQGCLSERPDPVRSPIELILLGDERNTHL